jgi:hypothetical protein
MRWLLTVRRGLDRESLSMKLTGWKCHTRSDEEPVPLGDEEMTIFVEGPEGLPDIVRGDDAVTGIFPNSDLQLD